MSHGLGSALPPVRVAETRQTPVAKDAVRRRSHEKSMPMCQWFGQNEQATFTLATLQDLLVS